ncbi:hypothetical protein [Streptomyces sp. SID13031]|uniref:hypothetical protein n=1 Tax=Streptomyces sp. SID13031 TaxID=2706046 RepID=UPI001EF232A1|nr:hypothetical protein [Streptomyces sp. SID13031]
MAKSRPISPGGGGGRVGDGGLLPSSWGAAVTVDLAHQARYLFAGTPLPLVWQFVVDSRGAIGLLGLFVDLDDLRGQLDVASGMARSGVGIVGGTGDLEQLTSPGDVVIAGLFRLDERVTVHRVSDVTFSLLQLFTHRGLSQIEILRDLTHRPITALTQPDDLGLEVRCERTTRPWLRLAHGLHDEHPSGATAPDLGCPSNGVDPSRQSTSITSTSLWGRVHPW